VPPVHLVHGGEVRHVHEEDGGLDHVGQGQAGAAQHRGEVEQRALRLLGHPVPRQPAVGREQAELAGGDDEPVAAVQPHDLGLAVGADRGRGVRDVQRALHGLLRRGLTRP
jgi:hypothetical protein